MPRYSIGFDFAAESVHVVVADVRSGHIAGEAVDRYAHGVIEQALPTTGETLPAGFALQHPQDWLDSAGRACRTAMSASGASADDVVGVGVAFASSTVLPALADGTPLCLLERFGRVPHSWPKVSSHRARTQAERLNKLARERGEPWLARCGGAIGAEWFFPKVLETLDHAPDVYDAADVWIDAGDWLVWQLTSGPFPHCSPDRLVRSTCQAGFRAMWDAKTGYPSRDYFASVHPQLANVVETKLPGAIRSPGRQAGDLTPRSAELLNLRAHIPVSSAAIDAHAVIAGAGVASPSTMVMVVGAEAAHVMNSRIHATAPGVVGPVEGGILPGYFGYEAKQPGVGAALAWCAQTFNRSREALNEQAASIPPGSGDVVATRWRSVDRQRAIATPDANPAQLYRAIIEASAFDLRRICDGLRDAGVPVRRFVASGEVPRTCPLLMQIYADVLDARIKLAGSDRPVALGAAILGCLAAGPARTGHASMSQAIHAMTPQREALRYRPDLQARKAYDKLYELYRRGSVTIDD